MHLCSIARSGLPKKAVDQPEAYPISDQQTGSLLKSLFIRNCSASYELDQTPVKIEISGLPVELHLCGLSMNYPFPGMDHRAGSENIHLSIEVVIDLHLQEISIPLPEAELKEEFPCLLTPTWFTRLWRRNPMALASKIRRRVLLNVVSPWSKSNLISLERSKSVAFIYSSPPCEHRIIMRTCIK